MEQNKEVQAELDRVGVAVEKNALEANQEPSIEVQPVKGRGTTEAPMVLHGEPDIRAPREKFREIIVDYIDPETEEAVPNKLKLYRLTVQEREDVAMYLARILDTLNASNLIDGLNIAALMSLDHDAGILLAKYTRLIAPVVTRTSEDFWQQVQMKDCIRVFNEIMDFETGIVKTAHDLFAMDKSTTGLQK